MILRPLLVHFIGKALGNARHLEPLGSLLEPGSQNTSKTPQRIADGLSWKGVRWISNIVMCGLLISCVSPHSGKMIQVDESFDGHEVTLRTGETLEVRLAENPSTGYRWNQPKESRSRWSTVLRQVDDRFDSPGRVPGKSGTRVLRFEAVAAGDADLALQYGRSWEKDAEPSRTFRLRVKVQSAG